MDKSVKRFITSVLLGMFLLPTLMTSYLHSEISKTKIYQTACVDLGVILDLIENDESFREMVLSYQSELFSQEEDIRRSIEELEEYLEDNPDFDSEKKKQILNDISFQKKLLHRSSSPESGYLTVLYQVIKNIAEREGFSMVIEKQSAVLYFSEDVDLTEKVINEVKNRLKLKVEEEEEE